MGGLRSIRTRLVQLERIMAKTREGNPSDLLSGGTRSVLHDAVSEELPAITLLQSLLSTTFHASDIHENLYDRVCELIVRCGATVVGTCDKYFKTVHKWLPVISKQRTYSSLAQLSQKPQAEFALVLLSIFVIIQNPPKDPIERQKQNSIYLVLKCLHSQVISLLPISLDILQSSLLIAVYEYGHSLRQASYFSMGVCMRAATALELPEKKNPCAKTNCEDWTRAEQEFSLWWCCIIVDK